MSNASEHSHIVDTGAQVSCAALLFIALLKVDQSKRDQNTAEEIAFVIAEWNSVLLVRRF